MESTKYSLQDHQFLLPSSSTSTLVLDSSSYAAATTTGLSSHFCWTPNNNILNSGALGSYANSSGALVNSRNSRQQQNDILVPSTDASMTSQDLSFEWFTNRGNEMISSSQSSTLMEEEEGGGDINEINVKLLLRTLSPGGGQSSNCTIPEDFYSPSSSSPLLSFQDQLGLISGNGISYNGLLDNYMNQPIQRPLNCSNIMTSFSSRVGEAKRYDVILEPKGTQAAAKRSRMESQASCPPFKVRKEKLGDRIAALQQLVAPFGKTDTASVLMEAIGYIKFLQTQVETLSVPYLKSSRNKTQRARIQGGPGENGNHEERKRYLKGRGLCLVPSSCLSYMTDTGGAIWPPPNPFILKY